MIRAAIATKHQYGSVTLTEAQKQRIEMISGQKLENTWLGQDNEDETPHPLTRSEDGGYAILLRETPETKQADKSKEEEKPL